MISKAKDHCIGLFSAYNCVAFTCKVIECNCVTLKTFCAKIPHLLIFVVCLMIVNDMLKHYMSEKCSETVKYVKDQ